MLFKAEKISSVWYTIIIAIYSREFVVLIINFFLTNRHNLLGLCASLTDLAF